MKDTLRPGLEGIYRYRVPASKTTPPGLTVEIRSRLEAVEGRKLVFAICAHDGIDTISEGTHERHVIDARRFEAKRQRAGAAA